MDIIFTSGAAYEYSDTSGYHFIANGVQGRQRRAAGESEVLLTNGNAYEYRDYDRSSLSGLQRRPDHRRDRPDRPFQIDLLYNNGTLLEYRPSTGYLTIATGVRSISKGRAGTSTTS